MRVVHRQEVEGHVRHHLHVDSRHENSAEKKYEIKCNESRGGSVELSGVFVNGGPAVNWK